jgi:hypothetical protein
MFSEPKQFLILMAPKKLNLRKDFINGMITVENHILIVGEFGERNEVSEMWI